MSHSINYSSGLQEEDVTQSWIKQKQSQICSTMLMYSYIHLSVTTKTDTGCCYREETTQILYSIDSYLHTERNRVSWTT